jgi:hypothetical protein
MEAQGPKPTRLVGINDDGGLAERVVNTIRTSVAPVPGYWPRVVDLGGGKAAIIVEVPQGTQTPYILIRTGQILVRTPASSEPVGIHDREALDRLFARGERGLPLGRGESARTRQWNRFTDTVEDGMGGSSNSGSRQREWRGVHGGWTKWALGSEQSRSC